MRFLVRGAMPNVYAWLSDIPDGQEVDLTVRAYDAAGNTGQRTTRIRVDKTAPTAEFSPGKDVVLGGGITTITATEVSDDTASIVLQESEVEKRPITAATSSTPSAR